MTNNLPPAFDQWCVVELLGHRRLVGRVSEATFPAGFLRIDEPDVPADPDGATYHPGRTQIVSPGALYAMHPISEDVARALAEQWRDDPIQPWELERAGWQRTPPPHVDMAGEALALAAAEDYDADDDEEPF